MWLPWYYALVLGGVFLGGAGAARASRRAGLADLATEAARVAGLYALWNLAGRLSLVASDDAIARGRSIWDLQQRLGFPTERSVQDFALHSDTAIRAANVYYGAMHVPAIGVFLLWLFLAHRDAYPRWRNTLAVLTLWSLIIQLIPVAPPRLVPGLNMIDTGSAYGPSVYDVVGSSLAGQATAMPSLHVGWAALIALAMWNCASGRLRWLGVTHFVLTFAVVVVTGHHFWLDGLAALALLGAAALLTRAFASDRRGRKNPAYRLTDPVAQNRRGKGPDPDGASTADAALRTRTGISTATAAASTARSTSPTS